jgi:pyridoxal phosphate enzyme (YggS family)
VSGIAARVAGVRTRIAAACARAGRDAHSVRLLAVSKTQGPEAVAEAIAAGIDAIGENRVQEAQAKKALVTAPARWHLIGPLQRNKAKLALELFDVIETVDRSEIADRLEALLAATPRVLPVLLEVNVGGEATKSGVALPELARLVDHVVARCPHLALRGVMTVPPYDPDPERSRPQFAALREAAARLSSRLVLPRLELSMGMSEDFEVAIEEGATEVRLGRIVFGERGQPT